jgi:hypothetical protein
MKVAPSSDWSVGLNSFSANSLTDATVLAKLGLSLRETYGDVTREPVPEHLRVIIERLEARERDESSQAG